MGMNSGTRVWERPPHEMMLADQVWSWKQSQPSEHFMRQSQAKKSQHMQSAKQCVSYSHRNSLGLTCEIGSVTCCVRSCSCRDDVLEGSAATLLLFRMHWSWDQSLICGNFLKKWKNKDVKTFTTSQVCRYSVPPRGRGLILHVHWKES